jgi:hypothetical protein
MNTKALLTAALLLPLSVSAAWTVPTTQAPKVPNGTIGGSVNDPVGDNFNPGPDLDGFSASYDGTNLTFVLSFTAAILPPPGNGSGNEVIGIIDIDTDQNGATGDPSNAIAQFCPSPPQNFGPEFEISFPEGKAAQLRRMSDKALLGGFTVTYGPDSVTVVVPNALLSDDGNVNVAAVIGNVAAPTDCAPDASVVSTGQGSVRAIPLLTRWALLGLALTAGMLGLLFARRHSA